MTRPTTGKGAGFLAGDLSRGRVLLLSKLPGRGLVDQLALIIIGWYFTLLVYCIYNT